MIVIILIKNRIITNIINFKCNFGPFVLVYLISTLPLIFLHLFIFLTSVGEEVQPAGVDSGAGFVPARESNVTLPSSCTSLHLLPHL